MAKAKPKTAKKATSPKKLRAKIKRKSVSLKKVVDLMVTAIEKDGAHIMNFQALGENEPARGIVIRIMGSIFGKGYHDTAPTDKNGAIIERIFFPGKTATLEVVVLGTNIQRSLDLYN